MGCGGSKDALQLAVVAIEPGIPASGSTGTTGPPTIKACRANQPAVPGEPLEDAEERRRLQALLDCHVLDTPAERRYDAICRLLCSVFKTPVAVVGLIGEDRLWFKSIEGVAATGGRRLHSFCDASLKLPCPTMMVVPDTLADARFQLNQFVTSPPFVRFYCGAPLVSTEGCVLGSLAVMDVKPRTVSADCANLICQFAELVVRELEQDKEAAARIVPPTLAHRVRSAACFDQAILVCDTSAPGWPALYVNDRFCAAAGMTEAACLEGGLWDLFHFEAPKETAQMLYAQAAIQEQKPFALAVVAGPPHAQGGPRTRVVLEFHPAGNDSFCSEGAPQIAIPSFIQTRRQSGRSAAAGVHVVVLKPPPLQAVLPLGVPPLDVPPPVPEEAAAGGMGQATAAGPSAVAAAGAGKRGIAPAEGASSSGLPEPETPTLPRQPLQRLRVPPAASSQPAVDGSGASLPSARPSRSSAGGIGRLPGSSRSGTTGTPHSAAMGGSFRSSQLAPATPSGGSGLAAPSAGHSSASVQASPKSVYGQVLEIDTSSMPRLRLVHGSSGRASNASLLSGGALPSPTTPASPLAPWTPRPFDQACPEELAEVMLGPLIGRGEHGRVYRGWWRSDRVAVKIIECPGDMDMREPSLSGPLLEAALSKDLRHDNIVTTHLAALHVEEASSSSSGMLTQQVWLVQQYCNRGTIYDAIDRGWLRQQLSLHSPPNLRAVLLTARDIASALAYLHANDVLHGDLTGSNVLLTEAPKRDGDERCFTVKVSDFGLSRTLSSAGCKSDSFGTVSHMPPELLDGSDPEELGFAVDIFSLGTLCWEMYCSAHAWAGLRLPQIIHRKVVGRERLPLPDGCPAAFKALVDSCLADDPEERPSAQEVLERLSAMLSNEC